MRTAAVVLAAASHWALSAGGAPAAAANALSEVVVTGTPYPVSLDSVTSSVNIIDQAKLAQAPPVGLGDLLEGLPGLRSTFYGPGASRPVIRGLSGPRVLILQNGVGLVDASTLSPDHAVAAEPSEASRIEVLRGPATLAYGGSAIGGVVNILDERVPSSPAPRGIEGHLAGSIATADDSSAISGNVKLGKGPFVVALDGAKRQSKDYDVPADPVSARLAAQSGETPLHDRRQANSDVDLEAYGVGLSYVDDRGFVGASVKRTTSQYGIPYPQIVQVAPPAEGPVYIDMKQTRYDLRGEQAIGIGPFEKARFSIGYADYRHSEIDVATGEVGTTFLSKGAEGRAELVQADRGGWKGAVGVQGLSRDFNAIGDEAFVPKVSINELGVFALQRLDRDGWGVEAGLRLDRRSLDAALAGRPSSEAAAAHGIDWASAARKQDFTNVSASGAVFVRPAPAWFASLSLSQNRRAPTEFELFADGPHPGSGAYELGDPTLKTEKAVSIEATLRWTADRGHVEAHAYRTRYKGFIDEVRTGERVGGDGGLDPDGELPVSKFTQSDATFYGGEIEASYDLWRAGERSLVAESAFDYVHASTDSGPAARIPSYSVLGRLVWTGPRLGGQAEVRHVGKQDRVTAFELPTDGYTLVSAKLAYRLPVKPAGDGDLTLFAEGRNLTNAEAREHTSFLKDIAPLPGRTFRLGFAAAF